MALIDDQRLRTLGVSPGVQLQSQAQNFPTFPPVPPAPGGFGGIGLAPPPPLNLPPPQLSAPTLSPAPQAAPQFLAPEAGQLSAPSQVAPQSSSFGGGLADAVARSRIGEFAPVAAAAGSSFGGGGGGAPALGPTLGQVGLGGFGGLPGVPRTGSGDVLLELGRQQQADVANQQQLAASALGSLLGGGGSIGAAAI